MSLPASIAKNELRRRAFDVFPQIGVAFDGSPIRAVGWPRGASCYAKETTGYMCSPIAYSVRAQFKDTGWCDAGERGLTDDELLTVIVAEECRP